MCLKATWFVDRCSYTVRCELAAIRSVLAVGGRAFHPGVVSAFAPVTVRGACRVPHYGDVVSCFQSGRLRLVELQHTSGVLAVVAFKMCRRIDGTWGRWRRHDAYQPPDHHAPQKGERHHTSAERRWQAGDRPAIVISVHCTITLRLHFNINLWNRRRYMQSTNDKNSYFNLYFAILLNIKNYIILGDLKYVFYRYLCISLNRRPTNCSGTMRKPVLC